MALALITGASSGIGLELAELFAERGYDLVVAAENDGIYPASATLSRWGVDVRPVQVDLRTPEGIEKLYQQATEGDRPIDAAALNAGIGGGGSFVEADLAHDMSIIDLNVRSTVHLAKLVLRNMTRRDGGRVLLTSSLASMAPGPFEAVYHASSRSFSPSPGPCRTNCVIPESLSPPCCPAPSRPTSSTARVWTRHVRGKSRRMTRPRLPGRVSRR